MLHKYRKQGSINWEHFILLPVVEWEDLLQMQVTLQDDL